MSDILAENDVEDSLETLDEDCGAEAAAGGKKTLPQGWRLTETGKVAAPDGKIYKNRRLALREMITSGLYSRAEVDLMRSCLRFEGWRPSLDIPSGWLTKLRKRNVLFVTTDGDLFESAAAAIRFVQKYEKYYSQADLDRISKLQTTLGKSKSRKKEKEVDLKVEREVDLKTEKPATVDNVEVKKERQAELPSGWQMRDCSGGGKIFVSSSGEKLNGISSALRFMVKHSLAQEDIGRMREYSRLEARTNVASQLVCQKRKFQDHVSRSLGGVLQIQG